MNINLEELNKSEETHLFPNAARYLNGYPIANENFARWAGVSSEIFEGFVRGETGLTYRELQGALSHAGEVSYNAMIYPNLIYLDPKRRRHRALIQEIKKIMEYLFDQITEYSEVKSHWDYVGYEEYFNTWYGQFEKGEATYSGYKFRQAVMSDMIRQLSNEVEAKIKKRKPIRGKSDTIPEDQRELKPTNWIIMIDPESTKTSHVTMWSNGSNTVFICGDNFEEVMRECERVKTTTLADKRQAYITDGIYDKRA